MLRLQIESTRPNPRHVARAAEMLKSGGIAIYPTDTTYGLGCDLYSKRSVERIYQLKGMERKQRLSFLCNDLSEISRYAVVENRNYRILKHHVPGPYTFILPATREVPKIVQTNTRTVGIRIPANPTCQLLIAELGHPLITTTVARHYGDGESEYTNAPDEIVKMFGRSVEVFLDGGALFGEPSSVVDLTGDEPKIVREGSGDLEWLKASI
ncbi:MAG: L-threonylcarbamoyladenylate synthase [Myxococcota bacterium]